MRAGKTPARSPAAADQCRRVHHRHAAAERDRQPAHGPRPQQHVAGHSGPLCAHARVRRALATRYRSCRHRHADGGRDAARARRTHPPRVGPRTLRRTGLDMEGKVGGTITAQLRRLGASCDWSRERFTMDDGLSAAVRKVFVDLHKRRLIYRAERLVNWDPPWEPPFPTWRSSSGRSRESCGIRYPVEGEPGRFIAVATTRPETMLGDTAVAVHPEDARYVDRSANAAGCRSSSGRFPLSPTSTPTRRRAPAPSRSRRRTTSTTSRSVAGTVCR